MCLVRRCLVLQTYVGQNDKRATTGRSRDGNMDGYTDGLWLVRLVFQRGLAGIYLLVFIGALNQFPVLLGEQGLLPAADFMRRVNFQEAPSIFYWRYSDRFIKAVAWVGILLSLVALAGISERGPVILSTLTWLVLWFLYL